MGEREQEMLNRLGEADSRDHRARIAESGQRGGCSEGSRQQSGTLSGIPRAS